MYRDENLKHLKDEVSTQYYNTAFGLMGKKFVVFVFQLGRNGGQRITGLQAYYKWAV